MAPILFSRYRDGMTYDNHVDDPVMGRGENRIRTDISFTLFLDDPGSYDGGELITDTTAGEVAEGRPHLTHPWIEVYPMAERGLKAHDQGELGKRLKKLAELQKAWPTAVPPTDPVVKPADLYAVQAKLELALAPYLY
ncbi:MAG: hypothetical protein R6W86_14615 [Marinobacter sp.]|uniref:hypothetical protein n=1 Tax=Marinobacter sp. TaxID=50741 RepID=UPI00396EEA25